MKIRELVDAVAVRVLKSRGFHSYIAPLLWADLKEDFFTYSGVSLRQKLWAYRHGFLGERIHRYDLNEENIHRYLPDFAYKRMHPINGRQGHLINNKLKLRNVFRDHAQYLPKYYWHVDDESKIGRLQDCPVDQDVEPTTGEVVTTLMRVGSLAAKPVSGSGGLGFLKMEFIDDSGFYVNDQEISRDELESTLSKLKNYIITEYLFSHPAIRRIWNKAPNTLRLVVANDDGKTPVIIGGFMRFGLSASGSVDNAGAGAIFCGIDMSSGRCFGARRIVGQDIQLLAQHPDSGQQINGFTLPNWTSIMSELITIACSVPQLRYMGFDIVITDSGFKFIEINSLPDIQYMQPFQPIFDNKQASEFFRRRMRRATL